MFILNTSKLNVPGSLIGGGGNHAWEITPATMASFQKIQYATSIIYGPCIWCIKVTLLLILVRVFTPFRKIILAIWSFIAAMLIYYIVGTAIKTSICNPIRMLWEPDMKGNCVINFRLYTIDTSLSVLADLIILLLPVPL